MITMQNGVVLKKIFDDLTEQKDFNSTSLSQFSKVFQLFLNIIKDQTIAALKENLRPPLITETPFAITSSTRIEKVIFNFPNSLDFIKQESLNNINLTHNFIYDLNNRINESDLYKTNAFDPLFNNTSPDALHSIQSNFVTSLESTFKHFFLHFQSCESLLKEWSKIIPFINVIQSETQAIQEDFSSRLESISLSSSQISKFLVHNFGENEIGFLDHFDEMEKMALLLY
jgi:hypothetical protein